MPKHLVIVESPAKAKTIEKFLGKDYQVRASFGHVRDLPTFGLGVDIKNDFAPSYKPLKDKAKVIAELKKLADKSDTVLIATDPDREGEAIAWHIQESTNLPAEKVKRIVFHEITKDAILSAIQNSRQINENLVNAQQARRILDRLIGYKLSPILNKKIRKGLSAGRVQSVTVKIICDREKEIIAFVPKEFWIIEAALNSLKKKNPFKARIFAEDTEATKLEINNQTEADAIMAILKKSDFIVDQIKKSEQTRNPYPPFITSTLQQDASRKLNWSTKRIMIVAQQLYEGIDIDGESLGLITYMRTDSTRISEEARTAAKKYITEQFGKPYLPAKDRYFKQKKLTQDAHEAIRPSYVHLSPKELSGKLAPDHFKLYKLIWDRFIASQMSSALLESTQILINATNTSAKKTYVFKATGSTVIFDGFTKLYNETKDDGTDSDAPGFLPNLTEGEKLAVEDILHQQKFTQPPPRYTEASLIKELEEKGIGRPSTYAPTLSTIQDRGYVNKEKKTLIPSELGIVVNDQLAKFFDQIIDLNFTADMETQLDEIMEGKHVWQKIVSDFYFPFETLVKKADTEMEKIKTDKPSGELCEKCGKQLMIKSGRYGDFLACEDYPNCKNTRSIKVPMDVNCPDCSHPLLEKKTKKGKLFYGCSNYPTCKFATWEKPINEACKHCQSPIMVIKTKKSGGETKSCPKCTQPAES